MIKERDLFKKVISFLRSPEPVLITGIRGVGKSTLMKYIYNKVDINNKLFLDFENPINRKYFEGGNFERMKSSLEILGLDFESEKAFIFLDEIREFNDLLSTVNYFTKNYNVKFFLTSSVYSPKYGYEKDISEGKLVLFELFPLSFKEFLVFKGAKIKLPDGEKDISRPIYDILSNMYEEYILFGGFPEVVLKKTIEEKRKTLENIFSSFFKFDVVQFSSFRKSETIRDLMLLLMQRVGQKLDVQRLSEDIHLSRATTYEYISFLEKAYFIKMVNPVSFNSNREIKKVSKVYVCDTGLINNFARISEEDLFKNTVFQNLRGSGVLYYYQKKGGATIDFVLNDKAYNVKISPKKSDISRLERLSMNIGIKEFKVISKNYSAYEGVTYAFML